MQKVIGSKKSGEILGVSIATVTRWAKSGKLPALHKEDGLRQPWLFDQAEVQKLADELKAAA